MSALDLEGLEPSGAINGTDEEIERHNHLTAIYSDHLESLDDASKEAVLIETFPGIRPFDIKWTLSKCKGKAALAIDELLNQVFLEDTGRRHQGIEAFSESELPPRPRKGRGKKKRLKCMEDASSSESQTSVPSTLESKWEIAQREVNFISSRTGIPPQQVNSIYHQNRASVSATIAAIIKAHSSLQLESEDASVDVDAQELSRNFPIIPFPDVLALTQITYPSTESAHELANALITRPQQARNSTPIQIEFRLPPPELSDTLAKPKPKSHNAVYTDLPPAFPLNSSPITNSSKDYLTLRNTAFTQSTAAYRRAKSDHLMSGAAAYYSSVGRNYDSLAKTASSAEAEALVASQSTATTLDLHGTSVKDAVRIAKEAVTAWWARNGSAETHGGYRIVTGKGTHSEGGKGKLGPAVGRMLIREGWKMEVGSGVLIVSGVTGRSKGI